MKPVYIEATTINDAWHRALYTCVDQGSMHIIDEGSFQGQMRRELDYITVHIKQPGIELSCHADPQGHAYLVVEDNGEGISPEKLEQVFVPFFSTREEGSGIGLSLCRQIMRLHYALGDRTGALRQYQRGLEALREELDVTPSAQTTTLYEVIRKGAALTSHESIAVQEKATGGRNSSVLKRLDHIINLQHRLTALQAQIQREIKAIEFILHQGQA